MRKSQSIPAFVFSLLLLLPLLLIAGLQGWQVLLKHQWKERLEQEAAQTITLPATQVVWEVKGKELVVDGKLFDVLSYRMQDGVLQATGVFDAVETRLETFLNTRYSHSRQTVSIIQLLLVLQCIAAIVTWLFSWCRHRFHILFPSFLNPYRNPPGSIRKPPPRLHFY